MKEIVGAVIFFLFTNLALAQDIECEKKIKGNSVCSLAKKMAVELSKSLPAEVQKGVLMDGVIAQKNIVVMHMLYNITPQEVQARIKTNNTTLDKQKEEWSAMSKRSLCGINTPPYIFINGGGAFKYIIGYKDGTHFHEINVNSCQ